MNIYVLTSDLDGVDKFFNEIHIHEDEAMSAYMDIIESTFDELGDDWDESMFREYEWNDATGAASFHWIDDHASVWLRRL